ncbi:MAG TPA: molybdopterin cofactor-binding domain-containing protein [Stellaceae bacterium]|nr:molybdopterin cofactor-binding domain-containing protein [Stellaceae bacterium]
MDGAINNTVAAQISRRGFMVGAAGLTFAFTTAGVPAALAARGKEVTINPWVTIATDGTVTIMSPAAEMGQGSMTSLPLILSEELDADWSKVKIIAPVPSDAIYGNPGFGHIQYTAGSSAVTGYFNALRTFGAQVRRVLLDNAAKHWKVQIAELTTEPGIVVHAASKRRLTYGQIAAFAIVPATAPEIKPEDLKKTSEFRLIGKDVMRVELPSKTNGTAQYSIDVEERGLLYGAVLRAPVEGAAPESVDDSAARKIAGVVKIVPLSYGVGVIAKTPTAAFDAKNALKVNWTRTAKGWSFDNDKAAAAYAATVRDLSKDGIVWGKVGDARTALSQAATVYTGEYLCDFAYHAQMEPLNSVASVSPKGDAVEIWCGTQSQTMAVAAAAKAAGCAPDKVTFHGMFLGGAYGRRGHRDEEFVVDSILLSKEIKQPVKVMWTREDDVHNGRFRPMTAHFLRAAFDKDGKFTAWQHRVTCELTTAYQDPLRFDKSGHRDFIDMLGTELKTYDIPAQLTEQFPQDSGVRLSSLRGIGFTANKFATEALIDEIAAQRKVDPVAFHLMLLKNTPRGQKVVETVARMSDWGRKRDGTALGLSFIDYSGSLLAGVAEISVDKGSGQIKVHNFWVAFDPGIAVQPDNIVAQTEGSVVYGLGVALTERITFVDGVVQQSNFYDYRVPRMSDVPQIHVEVIPTDNHPTGAGQMGTPLVAPAIANSFAALTGKRLRQTPMTPDRVLAALKA